MIKIIILSLMLFMFALAGCSSEKDSLTGSATSDVEEDVYSEAGDEAAYGEDAIVSDLSSLELLGEAFCEDRVISVEITNTGEKEVPVSDIIFRVNARIDLQPRCSADVLDSGESTLCSGLEVSGSGNMHVLHVEMPNGDSMIKKVSCN